MVAKKKVTKKESKEIIAESDYLNVKSRKGVKHLVNMAYYEKYKSTLTLI